MSVVVTITDPDLRRCAGLATLRIAKWGKHHRNYNIPLNPQLIRRINRIGVIAEYAVAQAIGADWSWDLEWDDIGPDQDVNGIQVRGTDRDNGCLITHDYDPEGPYVLVTLAITGPRTVEATLRGWLDLNDCCDALHWRDDVPYPAYFVPQIALHPIDTLLTHTRRRDT
ncbi:MAG: hypothetical protein ACO24S_05585 [Ilumatobacteraceae bacterium]